MTHYKTEREEHAKPKRHHVNVGTIGHVDHGKQALASAIAIIMAKQYPQPSDWPSPERIDIIGQNGNEGLHYGQTEQAINEHTDVETAEKAKDGVFSG